MFAFLFSQAMGYGACPMFKRSICPWRPSHRRKRMGLPAHTLPIFIFPSGGYGGLPPCSPKALALIFRTRQNPAARAFFAPPLFYHPPKGIWGLAPMFKRSPCPLPLFPPARSASQLASRFRFCSYPQNTAQYPAHRRNHSPKRAATGW